MKLDTYHIVSLCKTLFKAEYCNAVRNRWRHWQGYPQKTPGSCCLAMFQKNPQHTIHDSSSIFTLFACFWRVLSAHIPSLNNIPKTLVAKEKTTWRSLNKMARYCDRSVKRYEKCNAVWAFLSRSYPFSSSKKSGSGAVESVCLLPLPCRSAERLAWRSEGGKTHTVANSVVADWQKVFMCI
ncbi:hypothetical protein NQD34_012046 [Periophthalmus magnuspinnatus]|nr:hypothetical protein NQD34_012046 [Periophthalmus magnuspinnatus]